MAQPGNNGDVAANTQGGGKAAASKASVDQIFGGIGDSALGGGLPPWMQLVFAFSALGAFLVLAVLVRKNN